MTEEIPYSTHQGTFTIFGVELKCHRLSNGKAIIEAESMEKLLTAMEAADNVMIDHDEIRRFNEFQRGSP